jgi:hypothetical protein
MVEADVPGPSGRVKLDFGWACLSQLADNLAAAVEDGTATFQDGFSDLERQRLMEALEAQVTLSFHRCEQPPSHSLHP